MPDVVVVGGGIIGAACAFELAVGGASVTLLEREELAAGASGRNNGLWLTPSDPVLLPMAKTSLARYLEIADTTPVPFHLDREPIGLVAAALDDEELRGGEEAHEPYRAAGVQVDRLEPGEVRRLEPAIASQVLGGWLVHHGHRLAPAALTVALALMAVEHGATVRHHLPARALLSDGERVTGVVTDEGRIDADEVVVAAGPWSSSLLDPIGVRLPITGARGWLVRLAPPPGLLRHLVASAGWEDATGRWTDGAVRAGKLEEVSAATSTLLHPASDGMLIAGSSRQPVITPEAEEPGLPARIVRGAIRMVPALAEAEVRSAWWGIRPLTPDERPIVGRVAEGLSVAAGHGSEGVILGAGTGQLVAAQLLGEEPPFDPNPLEPGRFLTTPG
ncbi:MAG: FAD-dependent oxidoreductase [Actinomycetota bacterium]|nr:FAD-dependent oxidoreductase [Actinomycetota bacterium]